MRHFLSPTYPYFISSPQHKSISAPRLSCVCVVCRSRNNNKHLSLSKKSYQVSVPLGLIFLQLPDASSMEEEEAVKGSHPTRSRQRREGKKIQTPGVENSPPRQIIPVEDPLPILLTLASFDSPLAPSYTQLFHKPPTRSHSTLKSVQRERERGEKKDWRKKRMKRILNRDKKKEEEKSIRNFT